MSAPQPPFPPRHVRCEHAERPRGTGAGTSDPGPASSGAKQAPLGISCAKRGSRRTTRSDTGQEAAIAQRMLKRYEE